MGQTYGPYSTTRSGECSRGKEFNLLGVRLMGGFNPGQIRDLMSKAQEMQRQMQQKMAETVVEATAGGGSVSVKMNGQKHLLSIKIEPDVLQSGDVEMLQDLIVAAQNEAVRKVEEAMQAGLGGMLGGLQGLL